MALLSIGEILDLGNSANMSSFIPYSALDYNPTGAISSISGSAIAGGVDSSVVSSIVSSMVSSKMDVSASGFLQPSGDYAYNSALSSYLPASASGDFITSTAGLAPSGDYAFNSSVSAKLDASASSQFIVNSSLSSYVAYSSIGGEDSRITSISGSAVGNALATLPLYVDSANMSAAVDELSSKVTIGIKTDVFALYSDLTNYQPVSGMTSYTLDSSFTAYTASVIPVVVVADSADATGSNVLYVVTGGL